MFNFNKNYLNEEIPTGGNTINQNGCYEVIIDEAKIRTYDKTYSESLNLKLYDEKTNKKCWLNLFYKNRDGEDIKFNNKHISHLVYLLQIKPELDSGGNIPGFINKRIGIFLSVETETLKNGKECYKFNLQGFYDPINKLTSKEKIEKLQGEVYNNFKERYKDSPVVELNKNKVCNTNDINNDEDINSFFPVDNNDLPF